MDQPSFFPFEVIKPAFHFFSPSLSLRDYIAAVSAALNLTQALVQILPGSPRTVQKRWAQWLSFHTLPYLKAVNLDSHSAVNV